MYEDATSGSVGALRAAHISKDGARVCLASALSGSRNPLFIAPAASLERAVVCPLLVLSRCTLTGTRFANIQ